MKLYFNSFNNTRFESFEAVTEIMSRDLSEASQSEVIVKLFSPGDFSQIKVSTTLKGTCLDDIDIACEDYLVNPSLLSCGKIQVSEILYSDLLKSNCLVTHQPDWCSIQIQYTGYKISHESLLKYIVSYRDHNEFHEQCIERIFSDIMLHCKPNLLTVYGRYTRRGGLDINPFRTNNPNAMYPQNIKLARQ